MSKIKFKSRKKITVTPQASLGFGFTIVNHRKKQAITVKVPPGMTCHCFHAGDPMKKS